MSTTFFKYVILVSLSWQLLSCHNERKSDLKKNKIIYYKDLAKDSILLITEAPLYNIEDFSFTQSKCNNLIIYYYKNEYIIECFLLTQDTGTIESIFTLSNNIRNIKDFIKIEDTLILLDKNYDRLLKYCIPKNTVFDTYLISKTYDCFVEPFIEERLIYNNNSIFMKITPKDGKYINKAYDVPLIGKYSLDSHKLVLTFGRYSMKLIDEFKQNKYYPIFSEPSFIINSKKCNISFGFDPYIYSYNFIDNKNSKILAKSAFLNNEIEGIDVSSEYQDVINYLIINGFYIKLLHDPYKNLYYRIVKHNQDLKNKNNLLNNRYDGSWSIIVLDENFNTKYEILMPENKFNYLFSFVSSRGLFIQVRDSINLKFEIYNLK